MTTRAQKRIRDYLLNEEGDIEINTNGNICMKHCFQYNFNFGIFTEEQARKKLRSDSVPKLLDGKYFTIIKREDTKIEAQCNLDACKKVRKGDIKSTGNFMGHIRKEHPQIVAEVEAYRKQSGDDNGDEINKAKPYEKQQKTIDQMLTKFTTEEVIAYL